MAEDVRLASPSVALAAAAGFSAPSSATSALLGKHGQYSTVSPPNG